MNPTPIYPTCPQCQGFELEGFTTFEAVPSHSVFMNLAGVFAILGLISCILCIFISLALVFFPLALVFLVIGLSIPFQRVVSVTRYCRRCGHEWRVR